MSTAKLTDIEAWLADLGPYMPGMDIPPPAWDALWRAIRSSSPTVVIYGTEFDPRVSTLQDVVDHINNHLIAERTAARRQ